MTSPSSEPLPRLRQIINELIHQNELNASWEDETLLVKLSELGRKQEIILSVQDPSYVFSTTIGTVASTSLSRRELQFRIWRQNALKPLVNIRINNKDEIIGSVSNDISHTDPNEVSFYIKTLAQDCDRFEYSLSGSDAH